jgi:hypothetical protein
MTDRKPQPDFEQLVGADLSPAEHDRLLRVHELLVEAGPPPDLAAGSGAPLPSATVHVLRRRRGALAAIAAALGVLVFAVGFLAGARSEAPSTFRTYAMTGTPAAREASATIELFGVDAAGNWPMELAVSGLGRPDDGDHYELWLTRDGRLVALCGTFVAEPDGGTVVPMNAPWTLSDFDGWVVVEEGTEVPLLTT